MYYKLVVIAKGSDVGHRAARKAVEVAESEGIDTIYLLFVNDIDFYSGSSYVHFEKELEQGLKNIGNTVMDRLEQTIKSINEMIKVERIELVGSTAEKILEFVKTNKVETLIIPRDERGPIEKSLTGGDIEPFLDEIRRFVGNCIIVN